MPLDPRKYQSALTNKLRFERAEGGRGSHSTYKLVIDNKIVAVAGYDTHWNPISDSMVANIARTLSKSPNAIFTATDLRGYVDCSKSRDDFLRTLGIEEQKDG